MIQKAEISPSKFLLAAVFGIAFLILYFELSYHNRLATDDFFYFKNLNELGTWKAMKASYSTWVSRWFAILFLNFVLESYTLFHSLLPYHIFTVVVLTVTLESFIRVVAERFLKTKIPIVIRFIFAVFFIASFFFFSFNTGENWFWIAATVMYLWSIIFFIAGLTFIIHPVNTWLNQICCGVCFLFMGGAGESIAIHVLLLFSVTILYILFKNNFSLKSFWKGYINRMLVISAVALVSGLLISYSGEGRMLRQSALPETGIFKGMWISIKSLAKLIFLHLPLKIHWFIFFSVPWIFLGYQFASEKETLEKIFRKLTGFFVVFLLLAFTSFIPASMLLGETGPFRTWIPVSLYLTLFCMAFGFYLGYKTEWNKKIIHRAFAISLLTLIGLMVINILSQKEITSAYSNAVDKRMKDLRAIKQTEEKKTVVLDALPPSGMLYSSEISVDSSHFSNQHLKSFLDLKFDIKKRQ